MAPVVAPHLELIAACCRVTAPLRFLSSLLVASKLLLVLWAAALADASACCIPTRTL